MADISMCSGQGCPLRNKCYRHKAPKSEYQSWFMTVPYNKKQRKCEYFINNMNDDNTRRSL